MPQKTAPEQLTFNQLRHLKPTARADIADGGCRGLVLRVAPGRPWKWTLRLHTDTGFRRFVLGDYSDAQGIKWARDRAAKLRQQVRDGQDPHRERRERANALTLESLIEMWAGQRLVNRSTAHAKDATRTLRRVFANSLNHPADALRSEAIAATLGVLMDPKHTAARKRGIQGNGQSIYTRTVAYGRACFNWALDRKLVSANPFAQVPTDDFRAVARDRVLTDMELAAVWHAAPAGVYGSIVRLLILIGQRRTEVAGMAWAEISADGETWTIPGQRTKNGQAHIVPLSEGTRSLLPTRGDGLVFPGRAGPFNGFSKGKTALDLASGVKDWRLHDLRRTLATGLQRLGVRLEVTEAVLNHVSGSRAGIVGIYQRYDWHKEKRDALNAWSNHIQLIVSNEIS